MIKNKFKFLIIILILIFLSMIINKVYASKFWNDVYPQNTYKYVQFTEYGGSNGVLFLYNVLGNSEEELVFLSYIQDPNNSNYFILENNPQFSDFVDALKKRNSSLAKISKSQYNKAFNVNGYYKFDDLVQYINYKAQDKDSSWNMGNPNLPNGTLADLSSVSMINKNSAKNLGELAGKAVETGKSLLDKAIDAITQNGQEKDQSTAARPTPVAPGSLFSTIKGQANDFLEKGSEQQMIDVDHAKQTILPVANMLVGAATIIFLIVGSYLGYNLAVCEPNRKADAQQKLLWFAISVCVVYGSVGIYNLAITIMNSVTSA